MNQASIYKSKKDVKIWHEKDKLNTSENMAVEVSEVNREEIHQLNESKNKKRKQDFEIQGQKRRRKKREIPSIPQEQLGASNREYPLRSKSNKEQAAKSIQYQRNSDTEISLEDNSLDSSDKMQY